jgi:hypothetical protein
MRSTQINTIYTDGTSLLLARRDNDRTGLLIINRSGNTVYVSHSLAMAAGNSASMRLRPDDSIAFLKSELDDCSQELYILGTAGSAVEVVESFES